jgi:hypothetical protein
MEGSNCGLIERSIPVFTCRVWKTATHLCQDSRSPGRVLNPGLPEYTGVLTTRELLRGIKNLVLRLCNL